MTEKTAETLRSLVEGCRNQLDRELCELVEELAPALAQEARELSSSSRDDAKRLAAVTLQFEILDHWAKVTPALKDALALRHTQATKSGPEFQRSENLHILSDSDTFRQIAEREIVDRVVTACKEETNALERRISYFVLRSAMVPGDKTFRVAALCERVTASCTQITADVDRQILLLQLVGGHLAAELPQLYRTINETLIDADILPRLKRSHHGLALVDANAVAAESTRITNTLEKLVRARTPATASTAAPADAGAVQHEFFQSLKTLQEVPERHPTGALTNVVRLAQESEAARNVRPLEAVTLDIVAELFDLVFGDAHVAEGIKVLVARLQTPVLRMAMLNQRFFADRSHPARQFLDSISGVAIRWGKIVNARDPFYRKLSELVDTIQNTYDGDVAVFEAANTELAEFIVEREAIEAEESRILAEAVRAREEEIRAQRQAQLQAQKDATECLSNLLRPDTPGEIEQFLLSYWRDVLQGRLVAGGLDNPAAAEALEAARELLWTVTPKRMLEDMQRQAAVLPLLLKRLNGGFEEIGASATERSTFMDRLVDLQLGALRAERRSVPRKETKPAPKPRPPASTGPTLQVSHATKQGVRVQDISLADGGELGEKNTPDKADSRRVRQLVRGDWVDFITAGQSRRERLTWINPSRTLLLFSNSASECAISITPDALAVRLRNQTARLVKPDTPIFERALHGAVQSLEQRA